MARTSIRDLHAFESNQSMSSRCLWCSNLAEATRRLPALTLEWRNNIAWIDAITRDLASCRKCVEAYHAAREADPDPDYYGHRLFDYDVNRLISSLRERLALPMDYDADEGAGRIRTMLAEILTYPEYLLNADVAYLFQQAFEVYEKKNGEALEAEENFAGMYILLVHPSYMVSYLFPEHQAGEARARPGGRGSQTIDILLENDGLVLAIMHSTRAP